MIINTLKLQDTNSFFCTYFYSCIGNHNRCTSNCVVKKRNIQQRIGHEYVGPLV